MSDPVLDRLVAVASRSAAVAGGLATILGRRLAVAGGQVAGPDRAMLTDPVPSNPGLVGL